MKYFHYIITDEDKIHYQGEVDTVPKGFIGYTITHSGKKVYYKLVDAKMTEAIGEANQEAGARRRVNELLSAFLVSPGDYLMA